MLLAQSVNDVPLLILAMAVKMTQGINDQTLTTTLDHSWLAWGVLRFLRCLN